MPDSIPRPSPPPLIHDHAQAVLPATVQFVTVDGEHAGQRIDNFLMRLLKKIPKSHIYKILSSGQVRVNKGRVQPSHKLCTGDLIRIPPLHFAERSVAPPAPAKEFTILFEDAHLLVIDKPAGVAVHGGSGVSFGVIEQLRAARPRQVFLELVHRLDRDTSGILLLAKKRVALVDLHRQMVQGTIDKRYLTVVSGVWKNSRQHVQAPLFKYLTADGERRVRVQSDGAAAHTIFSLKKSFTGFCLLEAQLKTGRTHQIRVHLQSLGFPIIGDDKYGDFDLNRRLLKQEGTRTSFKRMFLHAYQITFTHPATQQIMQLQAPLPSDCEEFLLCLQNNSI